METFNISKDLISKLDEVIPDWKSLIDQDKLKEAFEGGVLDEFWLLDYVRREERRRTYRKISDRSSAALREMVVGSEKSLVDVLTNVSGCTLFDIDEWVGMEEKISSIIRENSDAWKAKNEEEAKRKINSFIARIKEKINDHLNDYSVVISNTSWRINYSIRRFDSEKAMRMGSTVDYYMDKFRKESERIYRMQEEIVNSLKNFLFEDPNLTGPSRRLLIDKIKNCLTEEVQNQREIRKELVNSIAGWVIGKYGSGELISFINSIIPSEFKYIVDMLGN